MKPPTRPHMFLRPEAKDVDRHPLQTTDNEDEFWVAQARRANELLDGSRFSAPVVSASEAIARMNTVDPEVFVESKRWMAQQSDREEEKRSRDLRQADIVEEIAKTRLAKR